MVIIDKYATHRGRLKTPEWKKWFDAEELLRLLKNHCREAHCRPISYREDDAPDGLSLAWTATK